MPPQGLVTESCAERWLTSLGSPFLPRSSRDAERLHADDVVLAHQLSAEFVGEATLGSGSGHGGYAWSLTGLQVTWRFSSLEEINRAEGKKHPGERDWSYGWSMMRIGAPLRRRSMADLDAGHERSGRALHVEGLKPHDPQVAPHLLGEMGLDPALVDAAIADPTTGEELIADHQRVVGVSGYGVPARLFPEGQCLFGPVLIDPPIGEAVRLRDAADARTEFLHRYELQRPKTPADEAATVETLRPHLQARDRGSINRGEVVRLPDPDAEAAVGGQGR